MHLNGSMDVSMSELRECDIRTDRRSAAPGPIVEEEDAQSPLSESGHLCISASVERTVQWRQEAGVRERQTRQETCYMYFLIKLNGCR